MKRRIRAGLSWLGVLATAQLAVAQTALLPEPGRPLASSDDATALRVNPALLDAAPDGEFRLATHYQNLGTDTRWLGVATTLALRIPLLDWGAGVGFDSIDVPTSGTQNWLTGALAVPLGDAAALGLSVHSAFSSDPVLAGLRSVALGYSARPSDYFALGATARNLNSPSNRLVSFKPTYGIGAVVRPIGSRSLELGLETAYQVGTEVWTPRGTLGVDVPGIGRFRGDVSVTAPGSDDRAWLASAGLAMYINGMSGSLEANAGGVVTDLTGQPQWGAYAGIAAKRFREPVGVEPGRYAVRLRLEQTPTARGHLAFLSQLWSLKDENNVDAVVLELRASPAESLAHLEELRDALFELRRAGKRTLCHLEDGSGSALFLCSAATKTLINPAGSIRFSGIRSRGIYFAKALSNLGVQAEFVRIGDHKSAPEQYTERRATEVANDDRIDLLQQFERGFTEAVASGRGLSFAEVRARLAQGPFDATSAKELSLVDALAFDDEIEKAVKQATGRDTRLLTDKRSDRSPMSFGNGGVVAIVHVDGEIVDGRSRTTPFIGTTSAGSYTLSETLKAVRENPRVGAVVVRVDSPGGSSTAADVIWRQVVLTAKTKPTVVSMGSVAASGGYYLAAGASRIFANPLTVTGSIGIYYLKADLSGLLARIGIDHQTYLTPGGSDSDSFFRAFTDAERADQQERIGRFYKIFLERVATGRGLTVDEVDKVAQGRVWTGEQALSHGLIDELGGLRQALAHARQAAGLEPDSPVMVLPSVRTSLLSRVLGIPGVSAKDAALDDSLSVLLPAALVDPLKALLPLMLHSPETPLARLDFHLEPLP